MAGDPVDHEAAEGRSGRAGVAGVDERQLFGGVGCAHDVVVGLAAPVADDGFLELLAVADGAVEVGRQDDVAAGGERGEVPAHAPAVFPRAFGAAVDEDHQRRSAEAGWFHDPGVDALDPEVLDGAEVEAGVLLVVEVREALPTFEYLGWMGDSGDDRDCHPVGRQREIV